MIFLIGKDRLADSLNSVAYIIFLYRQYYNDMQQFKIANDLLIVYEKDNWHNILANN